MKYSTIMLLVMTLLSACGADDAQTLGASNSPCEGDSLIGLYQGVTYSGGLDIRGDCTGYDERCESSFSWSPINNNGTIDLTIRSTNGGALCPSGTGVLQCAINEQPTNLTIDCGLGALVFNRN